MDITKMVEEGVELMALEKPLAVGTYYPSSIMSCQRKNYYSYLFPKSHDMDAQMIFAAGNGYHGLVQRALACYAKKHKEIEIKNEPEDVDRIYKSDGIELHGRMDCFLKTKEGGAIIEIKSISNINYAPKEEHIYQLNYYLHFYPKFDGYLFYMNKAKKGGIKNLDFQQFKAFKFNYDPDKFNAMFKRALYLHEFLLIKNPTILPEAEGYVRGGATDWECTFCQHKEKCFTQLMETASGMSPIELKYLKEGVDKKND